MKNVRNYAIAIILGILAGGLTLVGQKNLPIQWNFLANSGAIWLVPAFFVSYLSKPGKGHSAALCIVCLLFCVNSYYLLEAIMNGHAFSFERWQVVWTAMALIAGSVFGWGAYFGNNRSGILKSCGTNLLPAAFFSEGLSKLIHLSDYSHMVAAVITTVCIGLILYVLINRRDCMRKYNLLSFSILSLLGFAGYELLIRMTL